MALFGQLTKPAKELPLIDVSNPDIVMELLEELAITVSTSEWIKANEPYHPEAKPMNPTIPKQLIFMIKPKTFILTS